MNDLCPGCREREYRRMLACEVFAPTTVLLVGCLAAGFAGMTIRWLRHLLLGMGCP